MTKAEKLTIAISAVTCGLLILGGMGTIAKFAAYDSKLLAIEMNTKANQDKITANELRAAETPALVLNLAPNRFQVESSSDVEYVSFCLCFKNIGRAPLRLGTLQISAFESTPDAEVVALLTSRRIRPPVLPNSSQPPFIEPTLTGKIHPMDNYDGPWVPVPSMKKTYGVSYTLQPNDDISFPFDYLVEGSSTPKRYKLIAVVMPPDADAKWEARDAKAIIDIGPFPHHYHADMMYLPTSTKEASSAHYINAIPDDAVRVLPNKN